MERCNEDTYLIDLGCNSQISHMHFAYINQRFCPAFWPFTSRRWVAASIGVRIRRETKLFVSDGISLNYIVEQLGAANLGM